MAYIKVIKVVNYEDEGEEYYIPLHMKKDFYGDWNYWKKHKELHLFKEKYNPYLKKGLELFIKQD